MDALGLVAVFGLCCLTASNDDARAVSESSPNPAEAIHRLSTEFESAQRAAHDLAGKAKTAAERKEADRALPDRQKYARRLLQLAGEATDEASVVDALVWIVRYGARTPECDEAVRKIADRHVRSDRIATVCHALSSRGPAGESLLERIFDENQSPRVRGRACLGLAFARSLRLRQLDRTQEPLPRNQPGAVGAGEAVVQERQSKTTALAAEIERWLTRVLVEFPHVLLDADIQDEIGFLTNNLGPAAGRILRLIAESHPQATTRFEAECGLALQQMDTACLVAGLQAVAGLPPEAKHCAGPGRAAACVFGGEPRLDAVDSKALVTEIEMRLRSIADRPRESIDMELSYFHIIMDSPTLLHFHAGVEPILRLEAEGPPNGRYRATARRSLAIYLAGLADLSRAIDSDRIYWVERLGGDRVEQIRRLDPDKLKAEASALAEAISHESQEAGKVPDPKIERLRKPGVPGGPVEPAAIDPPRP